MTCCAFLKPYYFGKCLADGNTELYREYIRKNSKRLKKDALKLVKKANVDVSSKTGCNILDIFKIHKCLHDYSICIYADKTDCNNRLIKSSVGAKHINLFYFEDLLHFVTLKNKKGLFNKRFECVFCKDLYCNITDHLCKEIYKYCKTPKICPSCENIVHYNQCNRNFRGPQCFENHLSVIYWGNTVCETISFCTQCCKIVDLFLRNNINHICGEYNCNTCNKLVDPKHLCHVRKYNKISSKKFSLTFLTWNVRRI